MEQTLPLSESSTMPTRKLSVMRWVAFVLALIKVLGVASFFVTFIMYSIESDDLRFFSMIAKGADQLIEIVFWVFLIYLSSNRAVRNAMAVVFATACLVLITNLCVDCHVKWMIDFLPVIDVIIALLTVYAYSIVIMNTNLSSDKKGWFTILCLDAAVRVIVSAGLKLINVEEMLGATAYFSYTGWCVIFSGVLMILLVIARYQVIFSDAFAYTGFKKDDDGVVYRYPFFNRYTVGMFISSAVVLLLTYLSIVVTL